MGQARRLRERFFHDHPMCCFCGGAEPATTVDHLPSRAMFNDRHWPEGFAFPACDECQRATATSEQLFALLGRMGMLTSDPALQAQTDRLMQGVFNNQRDFYTGVSVQSANEKKRWLREQGVVMQPGQSTGDFALMQVNHPYVGEAMLSIGAKLMCALYYRHACAILPSDGRIIFHWRANGDFDQIPESLLEATPHVVFGERQKSSLGDQFFYRFGHSDSKSDWAFAAFFHGSIAMFGLVIADPANSDLRPFKGPLLAPRQRRAP